MCKYHYDYDDVQTDLCELTGEPCDGDCDNMEPDIFDIDNGYCENCHASPENGICPYVDGEKCLKSGEVP